MPCAGKRYFDDEEEDEPVIQKNREEPASAAKDKRSIERAYQKSFEYKSGKLPATNKNLYIDDIVEEPEEEEEPLEEFSGELDFAQPLVPEFSEDSLPEEEELADPIRQSRSIPSPVQQKHGRAPGAERGQTGRRRSLSDAPNGAFKPCQRLCKRREG